MSSPIKATTIAIIKVVLTVAGALAFSFYFDDLEKVLEDRKAG